MTKYTTKIVVLPPFPYYVVIEDTTWRIGTPTETDDLKDEDLERLSICKCSDWHDAQEIKNCLNGTDEDDF